MRGEVVAGPMSALVFKGLGVLMLSGVALQFFLAGMAVFGAGTGWELHATMGGVLGVPVIVLFLMSLSRGLQIFRRITGLLFALYVLQGALAALGGMMPILGALHPVNGLMMALIAVTLMGRLVRRD